MGMGEYLHPTVYVDVSIYSCRKPEAGAAFFCWQ